MNVTPSDRKDRWASAVGVPTDQLRFPQTESSVFPLMYTGHTHTHTQLTILRVFGDGLEEAGLTSTVVIKGLGEQSL